MEKSPLNPNAGSYEIYAHSINAAAWSRMLSVAALFIAGVALLVSYSEHKSYQKKGIIVLAERKDGGMVSVDYQTLQDRQPTLPELQYFANHFVNYYYSRDRATIADDFPLALRFMSPELREQKKDPKLIEDFIEGSSPAVRVEVASIRGTKCAVGMQCRLEIAFVKHFMPGTGGDDPAHKPEPWTVELTYTLNETIRPEMVLVNPMGIQISRITEYPDFAKG